MPMALFPSRLMQTALDVLFPQTPLARKLLSMNAAEFRAEARRCEERSGKEFISLFDYQDPLVRQAIWYLKYRGNEKVARLLAELLYEDILGFLEEFAALRPFSAPLLVPIPLSRKRERERGFNQCVLLAKELERLDDGRNFSLALSLLEKPVHTNSQTASASRRERLENLTGCFALAKGASAEGKSIILLDDVATTGATLEEARRTLTASGAKRVICFTVAH